MKTKPKNCKGIGKAHGFEGCDKETLNRKFGLCPGCLWDWMENDERGKIWKLKQFTPKVKQKMQRAEVKRKREQKVSNMSLTKYWANIVQPIINHIARLIDLGLPCIATGNFGKIAGGHFYSVGSNRTISLNLHNIHSQSFMSNTWNGGDERRYEQGLIDRYSIEYLEFVKSLKQAKPLNLDKNDLIEIKVKAQKIRLRLQNDFLTYTPDERIELRNEINIELGIYELKQSQFKTITNETK